MNNKQYKDQYSSDIFHNILITIMSIVIVIIAIIFVCIGKHHIQSEVHPPVNLEKEVPHTKWSTITWYPHQKQVKHLTYHNKTLPQIYHKHLHVLSHHELEFTNPNSIMTTKIVLQLASHSNTQQFFKIKSIKSIDKSQKNNPKIITTKRCGKYIYSKKEVNHKEIIDKQNINSNKYKIISGKNKGKIYPSYLQHEEFTKNSLELEK